MSKKTDAADAKVEKFTASLKVQLTPLEIADRADRAASILAERDAKEEEHKAAAKHNKAVIEALEAELRRLSNEVRTKSTYQPVPCERRYVYSTNTLLEVRMDTDEVILDRALTEAERQRELPLDGEQ
jgi:hypothetical protein